MDLLIHTINKGQNEEPRQDPVGEVNYNQQRELLLATLYLHCQIPIVAIKIADSETASTARAYFLKTEKTYQDKQGTSHHKQYTVGILKVLKTGICYVDIWLYPQTTFQVFDPEKVLLKETYLEG